MSAAIIMFITARRALSKNCKEQKERAEATTALILKSRLLEENRHKISYLCVSVCAKTVSNKFGRGELNIYRAPRPFLFRCKRGARQLISYNLPAP